MTSASNLFAVNTGSAARFHFLSSTTWTVPFDMRAIIVLAGGGGGGAAVIKGTSSMALSSGGGAGGCVMHEAKLTKGTVLTITVGARGTRGIMETITTGAGNVSNGGNGGTTTVTGGGMTLTANGGTGGYNALVGSDFPGAISGGPGGTASGGNILNQTGGRGGNLEIQGTNGMGMASGGGALGIRGISPNGGDCLFGDVASAQIWLASPGAGVGSSVHAMTDPNDNQTHGSSGQGWDGDPFGAYTDHYNKLSTGFARNIGNDFTFDEYNVCLLDDLNGTGGFSGHEASNPGGTGYGFRGLPGGGGGSIRQGNPENHIYAGAGGICAGGGGAHDYGNNTLGQNTVGGNGGDYGGGGGGALLSGTKAGSSGGVYGGFGGIGGAYIKVVSML